MAYDQQLANRVREYLHSIDGLQIKEKPMFGGLAFLINDKMCVNVGENQLMCRFAPELTSELSARTGFQPMVIKGITYKGYCYVDPIGFLNKKDFEFWVNICLDFNENARSSKKKT